MEEKPVFRAENSIISRNALLNGKVSLTKLGIGGGQLGNAAKVMTDDTAEQILQQAWDSGVRYFDSAPLYGVGLALTRTGKFLKKFHRKQFIISSKLGFVIKPGATRSHFDLPFLDGQEKHVECDYSYAGIMTSMQQNQELLQTSYLDIAFVHDLGRYVHKDNHETMMDMFFNQGGVRALHELREKGLARAIGIAVNEWEVCVELIEKGFIPDCIMLAGRYTLLDQCALGKFFDLCASHSISVIIAGVYNSGILSGDPTNTDFNYASAHHEIIKRKDAINQICQRYSVALPQAALHFPLLNPQVVAVVTGARSALEIRESAEHMKKNTDGVLWENLKSHGLIAANAPISAPPCLETARILSNL